MDLNDKIARLEHLRNTLISASNDPDSFEHLYKKIQEELSLESSDHGNTTYRNKLKQTISKQAKSFILAKAKWKSRNKLLGPYSDFVNNFKRDIDGELSSLKLKTFPPPE